MRWWGVVAGLTAAALLVSTLRSGPAGAQIVPDIGLETLVSGLPELTQVTHAGDSRLFLVTQRGQVFIWDGQEVVSQPFLDIRTLVSCCGERGLLSIAFHPQWTQNRFFFVNYTNSNGNTVVARYRVSSNPNLADPQSGQTLLLIPQPFQNHNGGQLQFGPDGYLYIGMGDGGSANDPECNGQRDDTLLGKMLRIDVNQNVAAPPFYGIPSDNPFVGPTPPLDEIWAKGLRNPWRFSFDRETGDLWIGDVGQGAREEIDLEPASALGGFNYGWKIMEGTVCTTGGPTGCVGNTPQCNAPELIRPIYEYSHANGDCSVTGGYVYRGARFPALRGIYVYGDFCSGRLWGNTRLFTPRAPDVTSFGEDLFGELYLVTQRGQLMRIVNPLTSPSPTDSPTQTPTASASPTATSTPTITLTPSATFTPSVTPTVPPHATPNPPRVRPTVLRTIVRPT
jgi:glucose/arabinose dehydrogenase